MFLRILAALAIAIFLLVIILVGFQTPVGLTIKDCIASVPFGDKAIHFTLMAALAFLLCTCRRQQRVNILGYGVLTSSLLLAFGITLEEFSQIFIPSRNFEMMDLVCNYAGIYFGSLFPELLNLKHLSDANHYSSETLSVQTVRHSTGPMHHESGYGRRVTRRLVRHHGRR